MRRWKIFTSVGAAADTDDWCPVCDHPFGQLKHACISSVGPTVPIAPVVTSLPIRLPEAVA